MSDAPPLHLFKGTGIELEYMVVHAGTLDVLPATDKVLHSVAGDYVNEVERGPLCWSNELMTHVLEFKTNGPVAALDGVAGTFIEHVGEANRILEAFGGRLMPAGMHPWMDPFREAVIWPHEYSPIYEAFNRIFDCRGHGWSNLQSMHINLPFLDDEEFGRLHAAIRLVLPILPALAASSPFVEGRYSGFHDFRLETYRTNAARLPSISGRVIPEAVFTRADYVREILETMYFDIAPHDPEGILQYEWLNARGAIARFERNTIEIRVLDVQESPMADVAIAALIIETLRNLVAGRWQDFDAQCAWGIEPLERVFDATVTRGSEALIDNPRFLATFGVNGVESRQARAVWRHIYESVAPEADAATQAAMAPVETILEHGTLSERILRRTGPAPERGTLKTVYGALCDCLASGTLYR